MMPHSIGATRLAPLPHRARPVPAAAVMTAAEHQVQGLVRWGFLAFGFSLPFEWPARTIPADFPTIGLALFLLTTFTRPTLCYRRVPSAFWWFFAYFWVFLLGFARSHGEFTTEVVRQVLTMTQLLLLFVAAFNLMQDERTARHVLLALALGCVLLALLQFSGLVSPEAESYSGALQRMHTLDQNSNRAGRIFGAAVMTLVGLTFGLRTPAVRPRILVLPAVALCVAAILQGGSRGSLLVLLIGLWLFTLGGRSLRQTLRTTALILVSMAVLYGAAMQSPLVRARWEKAQGGDYSGREEIFPAAWSLVTDKPLLGWGPTANKYELASRIPQQGFARRDTHNLGLELLTSTGVLGFVPFMCGLLVCLRAAWVSRKGRHGILPFALIASLLAGNMAANYLSFKLQWLVLAYAMASGSVFVRPRARGERSGILGTRASRTTLARPVV